MVDATALVSAALARSQREENRLPPFASPQPPVPSPQLELSSQSSVLSPACFPLALRALRPPQPVEVYCDRGRLDFIRGAGISGRVVHLAGPWRVQSDWWNEQASTRDYYDVQLSDGGVYRLFCERGRQAWFVDGAYD